MYRYIKIDNSQNPAKKNNESKNSIIIMFETVWQSLNMKCIQSPETEMLYICFNDDSCLKKIVKSHQLNEWAESLAGK